MEATALFSPVVRAAARVNSKRRLTRATERKILALMPLSMIEESVFYACECSGSGTGENVSGEEALKCGRYSTRFGYHVPRFQSM
jgi:hypothetical protein